MDNPPVSIPGIWELAYMRNFFGGHRVLGESGNASPARCVRSRAFLNRDNTARRLMRSQRAIWSIDARRP